MKEKVGFKQLDLNLNTASIADLVNCINEISLLLSRQNISFDEIYDLIKNNEKFINIFEIIIENTKKRNLDLESIGLSENSISLFDIYNSIFNETTTQIDESVDNSYSILEDGYDSVKIYLQEIARYPILPKEEQRELLVEYYNTKDKKIKEKLTKHNLRLVTSIAKKFIGKGVPFLELIQEGNLGLMHAIDKFDPAKSYSLTTYAYWEIRQSVARYIQNTGRTIRVPVNIQDKMTEITKKRSELEIKLGRPANHSELARELGMSVEELDRIKNVTVTTLSLEEKLSTNKTDSDKELKDIIGDDKPGPEEYAIINDEIKTVNELLDCLTYKEREIIEYRFGINGKEKKSLEKVSIIFNCTRERIRQIEIKALKKMHSKALSKVKGLKTKNNKKDNNLSIIQYLEDFHIREEELREALDQLEEEDFDLLNTYYNNELINPEIINNSVPQDIIIEIIEKKIKPIIIEERLKRKEKVNFEKNKELKLPKKIIPLSLFRFYQRYGYKKIQIEKALKILPQPEKQLLEKIYGTDFQSIKNKNITDEEKECLKKTLLELIPKLIECQNKNIFECFESEEYEKYKINYAFLLLSKEEKELLIKCFGINLDYSNDELLKDEKIKKRIYEDIIPKIKEIINNYSIENVVNLLGENVYEVFKDYECSTEEIDKLLEALNIKAIGIINKYYQQSYDKKINRENQIYVIIINTLCKMQMDIIQKEQTKTKAKKDNDMPNDKRQYNSIDNIYRYFMNYGYTREEITEMISNLNQTQLEKLHLYYGEDLEHPIINSEINPSDKKYVKNLVTGTLKAKMKKRKESSKNIKSKKKDIISNIYEYFEHHGYSKEEVNKVLEKINDHQRKILTLYYGKDLEHPIINESISEKEKKQLRNLLYVTLKKKIEKLKETGNETDEKNKGKQRISIKKLYEYFIEYGFTENEITDVLIGLTEKQKKILKNFYGEDFKKTKEGKKSDKEEIQLRNLVTITIKNKLKKIKEPKKSQKRAKTDNIYEYFKFYGYSEREVEYAIKSLNNNQFNKLYEYYGKDFHNPVIKDDISHDEIIYIRNLITITLKRRLKTIKEEHASLIISDEKDKKEKLKQTIKKIYFAFCMEDNMTERDLAEIDKETISYLLENDYLTLKNGIYEISRSKMDILLEFYKGMLKEGQKDFARKILDKCYKIDSKNLTVNDYLLEESIKNKKYEQTLKYLDLLINNTEENEKHYYNLILLLISKVYELPKEYKEKVKLFNINEIKNLEDDNDNNIRLLIYNNDILEALNALKEQKTKKDIIEILLKEISIEEKQEEEIKDNTNFQDIAISLSNNDLENSLLKIKNYLNENNKNEYYDLILNLIRVSILEEDNNYTNSLMLLASIKKPNLNLLLAEIVQKFYKSLMDNDLELSEICLNIVLNIDSLNEECLLKGNIEEIYKKKKALKYELKNDRLKEFEDILKKVNSNNSYSNILEELVNNDTIVIDDDNSTLLKIKKKLVKDPNIRAFMIGEKNKKLVVRKFSEMSSQNEDEIYLRAEKDYKNHNFSEALKKLLSLKEDKYINDTNVYYMIGVCYVSLMNEDNTYKEEAKKYISISNELSKYNDFDFLKNIELDSLIALINKKLDSFNEKKEVEIQEEPQETLETEIQEEPQEAKKDSKVQIDYNKLFGLILQNKNIDIILDELDITETEKQIVKLKLCKYLYKSEYYDQGDKLLKEVMSSPIRTGKIESIIKEITKRKKFYKYND